MVDKVTTPQDFGGVERCENCGAFINSESNPENKMYCPDCEDEFQ